METLRYQHVRETSLSACVECTVPPPYNPTFNKTRNNVHLFFCYREEPRSPPLRPRRPKLCQPASRTPPSQGKTSFKAHLDSHFIWHDLSVLYCSSLDTVFNLFTSGILSPRMLQGQRHLGLLIPNWRTVLESTHYLTPFDCFTVTCNLENYIVHEIS